MTDNLPKEHDQPGADVEAKMAIIDGVNGVAGHQLSDPVLREIVRRQLAGEITGDEARELGRQHLEAR